MPSEADLHFKSGAGAPSVDDEYEHGLRRRHTSDKVLNGIAGHGACDVCFLLAILDKVRTECMDQHKPARRDGMNQSIHHRPAVSES